MKATRHTKILELIERYEIETQEELSDYLRREEYGRMLLSAFDAMRESLPSGYAAFHLRWITEWHAAHRQYRQIARLLTDFPGNHISI